MMPLFGRPTQEDKRKAEAYALWVQQRNPFAIASMVLGVFSLVELGVLIVFGVASIGLGIIALYQLRRANANIAPLAKEANTDPTATGSLPYSPAGTLPQPRAIHYEAPPQNIAPTRGHRLAWGGITLSVISLIFAAILYLQRRGHP